jgi:hypothetical protein
MRIPVFKSRAQATSEAPGKSFTARMNAAPQIEMELRSGEAMAEAAKKISEFALLRANALAETEYNEALVAAEERMEEMRRQFREAPDLGNIFRDDGTGRWAESTAALRAELADGLSNRELESRFLARFDQQEVAYRFRLRDEIDQRIAARADAARAARLNQQVAIASDPTNDVSILSFLLTGADADLQASIENGTITSEMRFVVNNELANTIATNTTQNYVANNPVRALALAAALDLQEEVDNGAISAGEAYIRSGLNDDAEYTLATLQLLPRDQAMEILSSALTTASKFADEERQMLERYENNQEQANTRMYNRLFSVDLERRYSASDIQRDFPQVHAAFVGNPDYEANGLIGTQIYDVARNYLLGTGQFTPDQQSALVDYGFGTTTRVFAEQSNPVVFTELFDSATNGRLTQEILSAERGNLTRDDYVLLSNRIGTEADETSRSIGDFVKFRFGFDQVSSSDDTVQIEARTSYQSVMADFEAERLRRRDTGESFTVSEQRQFVNDLIEQRQVIFRDNLREDLRNYIDSQPNIPPLRAGSEIEDLDSWWNSLSARDKENQETNYMRWRANISSRLELINRQ